MSDPNLLADDAEVKGTFKWVTLAEEVFLWGVQEIVSFLSCFLVAKPEFRSNKVKKNAWFNKQYKDVLQNHKIEGYKSFKGV